MCLYERIFCAKKNIIFFFFWSVQASVALSSHIVPRLVFILYLVPWFFLVFIDKQLMDKNVTVNLFRNIYFHHCLNRLESSSQLHNWKKRKLVSGWNSLASLPQVVGLYWLKVAWLISDAVQGGKGTPHCIYFRLFFLAVQYFVTKMLYFSTVHRDVSLEPTTEIEFLEIIRLKWNSFSVKFNITINPCTSLLVLLCYLWS